MNYHLKTIKLLFFKKNLSFYLEKNDDKKIKYKYKNNVFR